MTTPAAPRARTASTASLTLTLAAVLTGALVLVAAAPARAHSVLADSTPTEGETLTALPEAFSVTANEPLLDLDSQGAFLLQIRDAAGTYYGDGCVGMVDATMSATPALGTSGDYTMIWQIVGADGHPVSGEIDFTWDAPADFEPAQGSAEAPSCGDLGGDVTDVEASPTRSEIALGIALVLALSGIAAAVVVAAIRRKRST